MNGEVRIGRCFLTETYLSRSGMEDLPGMVGRVLEAAEGLRLEGEALALLGSIFVHDDETWFAVFQADSRTALASLGDRARVRFDRVAEAVDLSAPEAAGFPDISRGTSVTGWNRQSRGRLQGEG